MTYVHGATLGRPLSIGVVRPVGLDDESRKDWAAYEKCNAAAARAYDLTMYTLEQHEAGHRVQGTEARRLGLIGDPYTSDISDRRARQRARHRARRADQAAAKGVSLRKTS